MKRPFRKLISLFLAVLIAAYAGVVSFSANIDPDSIIPGDVDGDGAMTILDATRIQRRLASLPTDSFNEASADIDGDGDVTILDATRIQRLLAGLPVSDGSGTEPQQDSQTPYKLVKKVKSYYWNDESESWDLTLTSSFEYKNAYPVKIENLDNYPGAAPSRTVLEYTFDGTKPLTRTETDLTNNTKTTVEYNDGRVFNHRMEYINGGSYANQMYQYGNADEYFTMVLHDDLMSGEGFAPDVLKEEVDSVSVITENGLLKRTTNTGIYTKWSAGEEKKWVRFRGVYTADYDSEGVVSFLSSVYSDTGYEQQGSFELTKENGRITEAVKLTPSADGLKPFERYVFEYTDTEISPSRYSLMINYFITGHGGNYYYYNWY